MCYNGLCRIADLSRRRRTGKLLTVRRICTVTEVIFMKILVVGLGLIGGSFCKAIKKYTTHHMIGMDCDDATLEMAIAMESVDEVIPMDRPHLMSRADLVIVAIPPHKIVEFILENKDNFRKGAVVTDVCGVKKHIVDSLTEPLAEAGVEFIGSHPMAGTEFSGFSFSLADMFVNASYLITPTEKSDPAKVEILRRLAYDIGFKTVIETTAERHDQSIAYTSQLAHVVSNSYIQSPTLAKEKGFSAGSFLDMTRVARLDENTWCDLFLLNRENLLFEIDQLMKHISEHRDALFRGDREKIREMLRKGRILKQHNAAEKKIIYE